MNLKEAREKGKIDQFIREREKQSPANKKRFQNALIVSAIGGPKCTSGLVNSERGGAYMFFHPCLRAVSERSHARQTASICKNELHEFHGQVAMCLACLDFNGSYLSRSLRRVANKHA